MKNIIILAALFLASLLIINAIYFELVISKTQLYRKEKEYSDFIKTLNDKKITYAFFGDSQMRDGINPDYINNSFNFATSAESFVETYYKMRKIVYYDNIKLRYVLLPLDRNAFSSLKTDKQHLMPDYWLYHRFVPYADISKLRNEPIIKVFLMSKFPFIGKGKDFFIYKKPTQLKLGWVNQTRDFSTANQTQLALAKYNAFFRNQEIIGSLSLDYFRRILELSKENNITLIFIKLPMSKAFNDILAENNVPNEEYYSNIFSVIDSQTDNYYVLNYYSLYFNNPNYFTDATHLNYIGAEHLSLSVQSDIKAKALNIKRERPQ